MKIWFTEIGEPLPLDADARLHRYGNLTRSLAAFGHDVTWWTSNFLHATKSFVGQCDEDVMVNGVRLRILAGQGYRRNVSLQRFRHQAEFARKFYARARSAERPDLIISPVPTLETACLAVRFGKENGIPVLTDIRDEWPDEFVNLAPKPARWAAKLVLSPYYRKMDYICHHATGIMGISRRQLDYGLCFAERPAGKTDGVFPIGYSVKPVAPEKIADAVAWWKAQGVREQAFVCCFFGTIGPFFNLTTVIEAARILSKEFDIQFVLCGEGSRLARYRKLADGNPAVLFPGWVDAPKIAALMLLSDAGLAPYASSAQAMSLPNKPFEYFSGNLPVASSIQGELKEVLATHQCGETYSADSAAELSTLLREWNANPDLCPTMGSRARQLLEKEYATESIHRRMEKHFLSTIEHGGN